MLVLNKINKSYSENNVIKDFCFNFNLNQIYKLSGPNGIGKTSLLKIIKGILIEDSGTIKFKDKEKYRDKVSFVDSNNRSFFHRLSVKQNLSYFIALNKLRYEDEEIKALARELKIENLLDRSFSLLSMGQMQMISLMRGMLEKPKILLLDEIFSNLDEKNIAIICKFLSDFIAKKDSLIIFSSHAKDLPFDISEEITLER